MTKTEAKKLAKQLLATTCDRAEIMAVESGGRASSCCVSYHVERTGDQGIVYDAADAERTGLALLPPTPTPTIGQNK